MILQSDIPLFRQFDSAKSIPYRPLATLPTPVERVENRDFELWVKRDDLTGEAYGGNKVRKLEFLLGEAVEQGKREVWTVGAVGSHHVLATSIYARQLGLEPGALHFPQPWTPHVEKNLLALSTTKPTLKLIGHKVGLPAELLKQKIKEWLNANPDAYYIPGGGSSPLGAVGYVNAALELRDQIDEGQCPKPDAIYVAAGTCGTLAGLVVGLKLAGVDIPVYGVRVVDRIVANVAVLHTLAVRTHELLKRHGVDSGYKASKEQLNLIHNAYGSGYGEATEEGVLEIDRMANSLTLEPTYTAKTFAAMRRTASKLGQKTVLYWHTLSGADLSDRIERASPQDLPERYQGFFDVH